MDSIASHTGTVKKNLGRGTQIGFPTANIDYSGNLEDGVYLATIDVGTGKKHNCLAFIGAAETFNETSRKMEVYILDFNENLYDKEVTVELLKWTRGNIKFNGVEELIERIKQDEIEARTYFDTIKQ